MYFYFILPDHQGYWYCFSEAVDLRTPVWKKRSTTVSKNAGILLNFRTGAHPPCTVSRTYGRSLNWLNSRNCWLHWKTKRRLNFLRNLLIHFSEMFKSMWLFIINVGRTNRYNSLKFTWNVHISIGILDLTLLRIHWYANTHFNVKLIEVGRRILASPDKPSLVQIKACRLFRAKPLSAPMMTYCHIGHEEHISMKCYSEFKQFHPRKCIWKYRLRNGGYFVSASMF